MLSILIFQQGERHDLQRIRDYLSDQGWARLADGVYQNHAGIDGKKLWEKFQTDFHFNPNRDLFLVFETAGFFRGTQIYYAKKGPRWPKDFHDGFGQCEELH